MKRAVCERCGRLWGVSAGVEEHGYLCENCAGQRKKRRTPDGIHRPPGKLVAVWTEERRTT